MIDRRRPAVGLAAALTLILPLAIACPAPAQGDDDAPVGAIRSVNAVSDRDNLTVQIITEQPYHFDNTQLLIDEDGDAATGFATGGAGVDFLVENQRVYRFVGESPKQWRWQSVGSVVTFKDDNMLTLIIQGDLLATGYVELYARTLTDDARRMVSRYPARGTLAVDIEDEETPSQLVVVRPDPPTPAPSDASADAAPQRSETQVHTQVQVRGEAGTAVPPITSAQERRNDVRDDAADVVTASLQPTSEAVVLTVRMRGPSRFDNIAIFIDADRDPTTGYHFAAGDGFEYAIYGDRLLRYLPPAEPTDEGAWEPIGQIERDMGPTLLQLRIPREAWPDERGGVAIFTAQGRQVLDRAPDDGLYTLDRPAPSADAQ